MSLMKFNLRGETKLILGFTLLLWFSHYIVSYLVVPAGKLADTTLFAILFVYILGFALTGILWHIAWRIRNFPVIVIILLAPILCMLMEFFHTETYRYVVKHGFTWQIHETFDVINYFRFLYGGVIFFMSWYLGYFWITNYYRFKRETVASAQARIDLHKAQIQMLRYQLNPHFLFNTLNSISALVLDKKNAKAEIMIGNLSRFLRFSLDQTANVKVTLEEEISILKDYLEIEETRFSDKLTTNFQVSPDSLKCLVPSFILQPAVENAIKHAIAPQKSGGIIIVSAMIEKRRLRVCIVDNGPGLSTKQKETGVGIQNMRSRLDVIYSNDASLELSANKPHGVELCITLPVELGSEGGN